MPAKKKPAAKAKKVVSKKKTVAKKAPKKNKTVVKKTVKKSTKKGSKKSIASIPKGYSSITPYLIMSNAWDAINFYKKIFAAKEIMRFEKADKTIGHAELKIGDTMIMLADENPDMKARGPKSYGGSPVVIHLYINDVDKVIDRAVTAGATLVRPIDNQFYGDRTGTVVDPYGHIWHIATHVEDVSPAEMKKRMAAMR